MVHRLARPLRLFHCGNRWTRDRLQAPPRPTFVEGFPPGLGDRRSGGDLFPGVECSCADPLFECGDGFRRDLLPSQRHRGNAVLVAKHAKDQAFARITGNDRGSGLSTDFPASTVVKTKASLWTLAAMTRQALLR